MPARSSISMTAPDPLMRRQVQTPPTGLAAKLELITTSRPIRMVPPSAKRPMWRRPLMVGKAAHWMPLRAKRIRL